MKIIAIHEKRARAWDRAVTFAIVIALFMPLPFARFQIQPGNEIIFERPILPWSKFRIRYVSFPQGLPLERNYTFNWRGWIVAEAGPAVSDVERPTEPAKSVQFAITPCNNPLLRWQNHRELRLGETYHHGEMLKITTSWQPLIFYPLRMGWQARVE